MPYQKEKIIFWGTSKFALPILKKLIKKNYQIAALVTAPDKPAGRKKELTPPPAKQFAQKHNLLIFQPPKTNQLTPEIKKIKPDLNIVAAYGQIIDKEITQIPKYQSINVHPSLLPKYRGPSPIQTAILNKERETGVTLIIMDEKIDHGPIIAQAKIPINQNDTYPALEQKLSCLGAELLIETIPEYLAKRINPIKQNENKATYCQTITRQDGKIDIKKETAEQIQIKMRAFFPWPGIWTIINGKRVKIIQAKASPEKQKNSIKTKKGYLVLELVQPEGKKVMTGQEFNQGYLKDNF